MPKPITVRFYQVGKVVQHGPSLRTVLQSIFNLGEPGMRERQLSGTFTCRLERLNTDIPGFVAGEMIRVRSTDLPCEVHPDGTRALNVDVPIGDGVAFWYREQDHKLAIQYDLRTLSPGRFNDYMHQMVDAGQFTFEPAIDPLALARFHSLPLRKLKVKLARPQQLGALEDDMAAAGQAFRDLGEVYQAPVVTLEMSMGHYKGQLADGAKQMVEGFLTMAGNNRDVRGITVTPDSGEGLENEDINLLDTLLSVKGEVVPASEGPDDVYVECSTFVRAQLDAHGHG
jgi:hypothetical protein